MPTVDCFLRDFPSLFRFSYSMDAKDLMDRLKTRVAEFYGQSFERAGFDSTSDEVNGLRRF